MKLIHIESITPASKTFRIIINHAQKKKYNELQITVPNFGGKSQNSSLISTNSSRVFKFCQIAFNTASKKKNDCQGNMTETDKTHTKMPNVTALRGYFSSLKYVEDT